jgi:hypothetical protein
MEDWVLVDTCIWASFFGKPHSPEKVAVDDLLDSDRVVLVGPIVAEASWAFGAKTKRIGSRRDCSWRITRKSVGTTGAGPRISDAILPPMGINSH